jgi:hypothetical protein
MNGLSIWMNRRMDQSLVIRIEAMVVTTVLAVSKGSTGLELIQELQTISFVVCSGNLRTSRISRNTYG